MIPPRIRHIFRAITARFWWVSLLILVLIIQMNTTEFYPSTWPKRFEQIKETGVLRVLVPDAPETFHSTTVDFREFDRALVQRFADSLNLKIEFIEHPSSESMIRALKSGAADLAVGIPIEPTSKVQFSEPMLDYQLQLIRHRDTPPLEFTDDLAFELVVGDESIEAQALTALAVERPEIQWVTSNALAPHEILDRINEGSIQYTVILGPDFRRVRTLFPDLEVDQTLGERLAFAWAFPETVDSRLLEAANTFLTDNEDTIAGLIEAHIDQQPASIADVKTFTQQLEARLPAFESLFREAALLTGWDWRLLVAVAYQESHLDPNARSPTGVRGIMMLTLNTMRELGYESRLDPKQSIEGGARYLAQLKERLPNRIKDPDRTWFTLAAYNMGMGHLEDARVLTERQGGNPDRWQDVAARLPLLQDPTYYRTLKFGFGRGKQAAKYVANIQQYYEFLLWRSEIDTNLAANPEKVSE